MSTILYPAIVALALAVTAPVLAGQRDAVPPVTHDATRKECGECHMAFQPALLPPGSWDRLMADLGDHFGESAELAPDLAGEIRAYLMANAGRGDAGVVRITGQPWWMRKHRRIRAETWQRPDVGAKVNCEACHRDAARGLYDDDD